MRVGCIEVRDGDMGFESGVARKFRTVNGVGVEVFGRNQPVRATAGRCPSAANLFWCRSIPQPSSFRREPEPIVRSLLRGGGRTRVRSKIKMGSGFRRNDGGVARRFRRDDGGVVRQRGRAGSRTPARPQLR